MDEDGVLFFFNGTLGIPRVDNVPTHYPATKKLLRFIGFGV